ncbi:MAG: DivIVA domain-containing protein [Symbiobacteriaceae bacterium]|nr:DivIVA domain-containing protein [Symbiobacteriaceae bacterium]
MLTPLDIHNKEFKKSLRGYDEMEVDQFLDEVVRDYETIYRELNLLRDKVLGLEERIEQFQVMEDNLKKTLLVAQEASDKLRDNAQREGELILREAEAKAGRIVDEARTRVQQATTEFEELRTNAAIFRSRIKSLLLAQVEILDSSDWPTNGTPSQEEGHTK